MSRSRTAPPVTFTQTEVIELRALLYTVLTNADLWDGYDLQALRRADRKLLPVHASFVLPRKGAKQ